MDILSHIILAMRSAVPFATDHSQFLNKSIGQIPPLGQRLIYDIPILYLVFRLLSSLSREFILSQYEVGLQFVSKATNDNLSFII